MNKPTEVEINQTAQTGQQAAAVMHSDSTDLSVPQGQRSITLAGGCFWGTEAYLMRLPGVTRTFAAYVNGDRLDPGYREVCSGNTGHAEAVFVVYDPETIDLKHLLRYFFKTIDPTQRNRQGNDFGTQYRSGIYYTDPADLPVIEAVLAEVKAAVNKPVATEVLPLSNISKAEENHQDYLNKNPGGYCHVSFDTLPPPGTVLRDEVPDLQPDPSAGSDAEPPAAQRPRFTRPDDETLKQQLTPLSWRVTQEDQTEYPGSSPLDQEFGEGIYVDITTGEPLFTSYEKYDAGCGWPSFFAPIEPGLIAELKDTSHGMIRTEVRSSLGDAHLGHVFNDGPREFGGLRYCINGASLRFVPREEMEAAGYGYLLPLLAEKAANTPASD